MTFHEFAKFCDKISNLSEKQKTLKVQCLNIFLDSCRAKFNDKEKDSMFPIMRLLMPYNDKLRGAYGIKESVMGSLYIDMLQLGTNSPDARRIKAVIGGIFQYQNLSNFRYQTVFH